MMRLVNVDYILVFLYLALLLTCASHVSQVSIIDCFTFFVEIRYG